MRWGGWNKGTSTNGDPRCPPRCLPPACRPPTQLLPRRRPDPHRPVLTRPLCHLLHLLVKVLALSHVHPIDATLGDLPPYLGAGRHRAGEHGALGHRPQLHQQPGRRRGGGGLHDGEGGRAVGKAANWGPRGCAQGRAACHVTRGCVHQPAAPPGPPAASLQAGSAPWRAAGLCKPGGGGVIAALGMDLQHLTRRHAELRRRTVWLPCATLEVGCCRSWGGSCVAQPPCLRALANPRGVSCALPNPLLPLPQISRCSSICCGCSAASCSPLAAWCNGMIRIMMAALASVGGSNPPAAGVFNCTHAGVNRYRAMQPRRCWLLAAEMGKMRWLVLPAWSSTSCWRSQRQATESY